MILASLLMFCMTGKPIAQSGPTGGYSVRLQETSPCSWVWARSVYPGNAAGFFTASYREIAGAKRQRLHQGYRHEPQQSHGP